MKLICKKDIYMDSDCEPGIAGRKVFTAGKIYETTSQTISADSVVLDDDYENHILGNCHIYFRCTDTIRRFTDKELHELINSHLQMDPRHALTYLDFFAVNFPYSSIEVDVIGIGNRSCGKEKFKELYSKYRAYINECDPAGGFGLESHI